MSKRNLFEYRKIALAPAEHAKVEVTFDGTFADGDELCSDTPTTDKLLVAAYAEVTTLSGVITVVFAIDNTSIFCDIHEAGGYGWLTLTAIQTYEADGAWWSESTHFGKGWKLGYKISLKARGAGTASGKLVLYYAIFA
jgi:hypothetical protein